MNEKDWAAVKAWIALEIANLCDMVGDDGIIIEIGTMASDVLKGRRGKNGN